MNTRSILSLSAAITLTAQAIYAPVASAVLRTPISGLAVEQGMEPSNDYGEKESTRSQYYDLGQSATLQEIAKFLLRYMPGETLLFSSEPVTKGDSIDLRMLLLQMAMPLAGRHGQSHGHASSQTIVLTKPLLETDTAKTGEGADEAKGQSNELNAPDMLSNSDALATSTTAQRTASSSPAHNLLSLSMSTPFGANAASSASLVPSQYQFLLWTLLPNPNLKPPSTDLIPTSNNDFQGSFVELMPGTKFSSIQNRHFALTAGRLLACNHGGDLVFETTQADVNLPVGAAVIIDRTDKDVLRIIALEAASSAPIQITPKARPGQSDKVDTITLAKGQQIIVSDRNLADSEIVTPGGIKVEITSRDNRITKTTVSLPEIVAKDALLNAKFAGLGAKQHSALSSLLESLK